MSFKQRQFRREFQRDTLPGLELEINMKQNGNVPEDTMQETIHIIRVRENLCHQASCLIQISKSRFNCHFEVLSLCFIPNSTCT